MVKNNLGVLQAKQWAVIIGVVLVVSVFGSLVGTSIGKNMTGNAIYNGAYSLKVQPKGTFADTWIPYSDGNVYLTSDGTKWYDGVLGGDIILRKWIGGSGINAYQNLMTVDKDGNVRIEGSLYLENPISSKSLKGSGNAYACIDSNGEVTRQLSPCTACGDGACESVKGENCATCAIDCKCLNGYECSATQKKCVVKETCGDGICSTDENCATCSADCGCEGIGEFCNRNTQECEVCEAGYNRCVLNKMCGYINDCNSVVNCGSCPAGKNCYNQKCV